MEEHAVHQKSVHVLWDGLAKTVNKVSIDVCILSGDYKYP